MKAKTTSETSQKTTTRMNNTMEADRRKTTIKEKEIMTDREIPTNYTLRNSIRNKYRQKKK
jgi:hypothetical protein